MSLYAIHAVSFIVTVAVIYLGFRWHFAREKEAHKHHWKDARLLEDIRLLRARLLAARAGIIRLGGHK